MSHLLRSQELRAIDLPLNPALARMKTLSAPRCTLEPQVAAHAHEMFVVLSDPAIYEFEGQAPSSEAALAQRFALLESRCSADGTERWLNWVVRVPGGPLAGYVQATVLPSGVSFVAYELASRFWRQGIASSAVTAVLSELGAAYGVHTYIAVLKAQNFRSQALLDSLGFRLAGAHEQVRYRDEPDEIVMVKLAEPSSAA
jgi:RimJ/RimL family protein N-acetyltransferase